METESLLNDVYPDVCKSDYCGICFRTCNERRLTNGINLAKFKLLRQSNYLEIYGNIDKYSGQKICFMCNAQAIAANRFCLAVNLSQHLHNLFHKMKKQPDFATQVKNYLSNVNHPTCEVIENHKYIEDLQKMLEQLRKDTTLLQTETLLLNQPGTECREESSTALATSVPPPTARAVRDRESLRDLLTFESQSGIDETLFHFNESEIFDNKEIIILDDDTIKEEPPDQNMFIIPDAVPTDQTNTQTENATGYLLHPIIVDNGTITIPSLDKNISNNTNNKASLSHFVVTPLTQTTAKTQNVTSNSNKNTPNLNFIQNTNSLAKNIVSLVKNPSNLSQNTVNLARNRLDFLQNKTNINEKILNVTERANLIGNTPPAKPRVVPIVLRQQVNTVKEPAGPVKRPDSDSNTNCQNIQPLRKAEAKIDWEDKIPMDVISFVSPSDPTTMTAAKRQKVLPGVVMSSGTSGNSGRDPMDECIITEVRSEKTCHSNSEPLTVAYVYE